MERREALRALIERWIVAVLMLALSASRGTCQASLQSVFPATTPSAAWHGAWDLSHVGIPLNKAGLVVAKSIAFRAGNGNACLDAATGQPAIGRFRAGAAGFDLYAENTAGFNTEVTGGVAFLDSTAAVVPYDCAGNMLNLHLTDKAGAWQSALLYGVDRSGKYGDSAAYGLFEQTIVLPAPTDEKIPWPSSWTTNNLVQPDHRSYAEIDWFEAGRNSASLSDQLINLYNWPPPFPLTNQLQHERGFSRHISADLFDGQKHVYSMLKTPTKIVIYWDGVEQARYPVTAADMNAPFYHAVDLSMYYDPGANMADYTMSVPLLTRWTCAGAPICLDAINP